MNPKRLFTLIVSVLLLWASHATAEFTVRTIYFQPQGEPDKTAEVREMMAEVHRTYAQEMERHGYGLKSFRVETDNNQIVVHTVRGKHNADHYATAPKTYIAIAPELPDEFSDQTDNIHIIFMGGLHRINGGRILGVGVASFGNKGGGYAMLPAERLSVRLVAHEVGHTFGLGHNIDPTFIMSSGHHKFSHNEARWMDKSHYFNKPPAVIRFIPQIENISLLRLLGTKTLHIETDVSSPNGVYQAEVEQLSDRRVLQWDYLNGQPRDTAVFDFKAALLRHNTARKADLLLRVMDRKGNMWIKVTEVTVPKQRVKNTDIAETTPEPLPETVGNPELEKDDMPRNVIPSRKIIILWAKLKR